MKVRATGTDEVLLARPVEDVQAVLADPEQLLELVQDLLSPRSSPHRWVMAEVRLGPVAISPAVDVTIREVPGRVTVTGRPVDGRTRTTLDIDLLVTGTDATVDATTVASTWRVGVEVPGPQLMAATVHPLVTASGRRTARRIGDRLRGRFGSPPA